MEKINIKKYLIVFYYLINYNMLIIISFYSHCENKLLLFSRCPIKIKEEELSKKLIFILNK